VHLLQPSKYDSTPDLQVTHGVRVGDGDGDLGGHSFFVQPARLPFLHVHVLLWKVLVFRNGKFLLLPAIRSSDMTSITLQTQQLTIKIQQSTIIRTTLAQGLFAGAGSFGSQYLRVHTATRSSLHVHMLQPSKYDETPDLHVQHGETVDVGDGGHSFLVHAPS